MSLSLDFGSRTKKVSYLHAEYLRLKSDISKLEGGREGGLDRNEPEMKRTE